MVHMRTDLRQATPELGTAAFYPVGTFATAADGELAQNLAKSVLWAEARAYEAQGSFYIDPKSRAIFDKCVTKPTHRHLSLIDDVICMLRDWVLINGDKLTLFSLPLHNEVDSLAIPNWLDTAAAAIAKSGTLTFVPGAHWVGAGTAAYLQYPYTPAQLFTQDAASFMAWFDGANDGNSIAITGAGGVENFSLLPRSSASGNLVARFNSTTAVSYATDLWGESAALEGRNGTFGLTRSEAGNVMAYRQGYRHATGAAVSSAPHANQVRVNWQAATGTPDKFRGMIAAKVALSEAEMRALHRIMEYYLLRAPTAIATGTACEAGDIDAAPIDDYGPIQDAVDAGVYVTISAPADPWKTYWLSQEVKIPSNRIMELFTTRVNIMATAPDGHCCFTNSDRVNGNQAISFYGGRLYNNKGNRLNVGYAENPDWEGRCCLALCRVDDVVVKRVEARGAWLHCINVSSTDEAYLGNTDYKDGTGATADQSSKRVVIEDCHTFDHGDDGITTHGAHRIIIRGNYCWGGMGSISGGSSGIEVDDWCRKAIIEGNHVWDMLPHSELVPGSGSVGIIAKGHDTTPSADSAIISKNFVSRCFEGIAVHNNTTIRRVKDAIVTDNILEDFISCGIRTYSGYDLSVCGNHIKKSCRDVQDSGAIRMTNDAMTRKVNENTIINSGKADFAIYLAHDTVAPIAQNVQNNILNGVYQALRMVDPNMIVSGNNCTAGTTVRGAAGKGVAPAATATSSLLTSNRFVGFSTGADMTMAPVSLVADNNVTA